MCVLQEANQVVNPKLLELAQCGMGFKGKYGTCSKILYFDRTLADPCPLRWAVSIFTCDEIRKSFHFEGSY